MAVKPLYLMPSAAGRGRPRRVPLRRDRPGDVAEVEPGSGQNIFDVVTAGLTLCHSSGPVEGAAKRIKMIKRQMLDRAKMCTHERHGGHDAAQRCRSVGIGGERSALELLAQPAKEDL